MPHKEPSQNLSGHAAGWRSVSQKYNVIRSPDEYPCLVLALLYLEQEKKVWALAFLNYRSSINIANTIFSRESVTAWHNFAPIIVPKAGVAFKEIGVWIGIKCVTTSLRQARPLCRDCGHTNRGGLKIRRADVLLQSWSYLVIRPWNKSFCQNHHSTPLFLTKLMHLKDSFYFAICRTLEKHGERKLSMSSLPIPPLYIFTNVWIQAAVSAAVLGNLMQWFLASNRAFTTCWTASTTVLFPTFIAGPIDPYKFSCASL